MNIVYCITCHRRTTALEWSVEYLSSFNENEILIHIDSKSNINEFSDLKKDNVRFTNKRVDVKWGHISQVESTIILLEEAKRKKFDYIFFISGDDIPLVSNKYILNFLKKYNGIEFIGFQQDEQLNFFDPSERVKINYTKFHFGKEKGLLSRIARKTHSLLCKFGFFSNDLFLTLPDLKKGTNWFTLTYEGVEYNLVFIKNNPSYHRAFAKSFCADEIYFHSIIYNSPLMENVFLNKNKKTDCLRYIDWTTGPDYPRSLDVCDFEKIKKSGMFFARKMPTNMNKDLFKSLIMFHPSED